MSSAKSKSSSDDPGRWGSRGTAILGAGVGSAIGLFTGTPGGAIGGAIVGEAIGQVAEAIAFQQFSARQDQRVSKVMVQAAASLKVLEIKGMTVRRDGFFDGEWSIGNEIIEGVLLAAKSTYEEHKLPYLGNMLARIACEDTIDRHTANLMIRMADDLSWLHLIVMSIIERKDVYPLPDLKPGPTIQDWRHWTPARALIQLRDNLGLVTFPHSQTTEEPRVPIDLRMSSLGLTNEGMLLASSMELSTIPNADVKPIYEKLLDMPVTPARLHEVT